MSAFTVSSEGWRNSSAIAYGHINTSTALLAMSISLAAISLLCGLVILYMCVYRVLNISRDLLDMLASLILCEMVSEVGMIHGALIHGWTDAEGRANPCDLSISCSAQSFYTSYFNMAALEWTIVIEACCLHVMLTNANTFSFQPVVRRCVYIVCSVIPFVICIVALEMGALGETLSRTTANYCWITSCDLTVPPNMQIMWMFLTGKALEIVAYFSVTNCVFMLFFLRRRKATKLAMQWAETDEQPSESTRMRTVSSLSESSLLLPAPSGSRLDPAWRMFALIPFCYVATRGWGTLRFFFDISQVLGVHLSESGQITNDIFLYFQAIGDGCLITIKLMLILLLRKEARDFCASLFRCCTFQTPASSEYGLSSDY